MVSSLDYEQQRRDLLHKHGIDLEESNGLGDGTRTKRLDRKEVERLMGGGDGQSGVFTWREKHRRKVRRVFAASPPYQASSHISRAASFSSHIQCAFFSPFHDWLGH